MISASDRKNAVMLIDEAVASGASLAKACNELGIKERTYYRWIRLKKETGSYDDLRPNAERKAVIVKIVVSKILIFIGYISSGLLNSTLGYNHLSMTRQVAAQSLTDNFNPAFSVAKPDEKGIMKPKLPFPYLYW